MEKGVCRPSTKASQASALLAASAAQAENHDKRVDADDQAGDFAQHVHLVAPLTYVPRSSSRSVSRKAAGSFLASGSLVLASGGSCFASGGLGLFLRGNPVCSATRLSCPRSSFAGWPPRDPRPWGRLPSRSADEGAFPDAVVVGQQVQPPALALIARIDVCSGAPGPAPPGR